MIFFSQDNQSGVVTDIDIWCAVKLVGTNCVLYPVNSKDLQHIWVRRASPGLVLFLVNPFNRSIIVGQTRASLITLITVNAVAFTL